MILQRPSVLKTTKSINAGDEVRIAYAAEASNEMLLYTFGFIVPGNTTASEVTMYSFDLIVHAAKQAGITRTPTTTVAWKEMMLPELRRVPRVRRYVLYGFSSHPGSDTPTLSGKLSTEPDEAGSYPLKTLAMSILILLQTCKLDKPVEEASATLQAIYRLQLSSYETTIDEDLAILANLGSLTPAMRLAVEYRVDVKKTLLNRISRCTHAMDDLIRTETADFQEIRKIGQ